MTKKIFLAFALLLSHESFAQSFASLDASFYNTKDIKPAWGLDFTGGAIIKDRHNKGARTLTLGAGAGVYMFTQNDAYIPLFATFGYFNKNKKITPYVNARVGYGIYKGSARFIGKNETVKGGLYGNIRAGAGLKVTKHFYPTPFIGVTLVTLRKFNINQSPTIYHNGLINAGISLMF